MDKPFLSFVSSVLDITIIKPIIEACTGEDLITGEDLSDLECQLKLVFAGVDIATLGGAMGATRLSELGMKEALQTMGKTVAVEFMGNTAVCGIGAIGQAFDWPVQITIMLSLVTGITVSCVGNKLVFEGEGFYREVPVEEIEEIRKVESGSKTGAVWDNITSTADNMPATEIPATFKINLDGNINYVNPETGMNTLWTNSNATKHMGEYVSRFGEESWSIGTRSQAM